jgi:hypothetical protein
MKLNRGHSFKTAEKRVLPLSSSRFAKNLVTSPFGVHFGRRFSRAIAMADAQKEVAEYSKSAKCKNCYDHELSNECLF